MKITTWVLSILFCIIFVFFLQTTEMFLAQMIFNAAWMIMEHIDGKDRRCI